MLLSTYRRAAEPLAVVVGPTPVEGGLHAGLVLVGERLPKADISLRDVEGGELLRVRLLPDYLNQSEPRVYRNVTLEVIEHEHQ